LCFGLGCGLGLLLPVSRRLTEVSDGAAGTGCFLDQQASRLQYQVEEIGAIARFPLEAPFPVTLNGGDPVPKCRELAAAPCYEVRRRSPNGLSARRLQLAA